MHDEPFDPTCEQCQERSAANGRAIRKNFEDNWANLGFMSVPGGASVARLGGGAGSGLTPSQSQRKFDGDLDAYRSSKAGGLQPEQSTKESVEKVERRVESHDRVMDQHAKGNLQLGDRLKETIAGDFT